MLAIKIILNFLNDMNELIFFTSIVVSYCLVLLFYKFLGKLGMFVWIASIAIIANIEVIKCVDILGMSVTLGNALYCSISLATDILNERYGAHEARKSALIGFMSLVVLVILSQIALLFTPNESDFASDALQTVFATTPRICAASLSCFLLSNILDTYIFSWLRKKCKFLWIRVNVSTLLSQLLDSILFFVIAFSFALPWSEILMLGITCYIIKVVITVCDTPFIYWSRKINPLQ